MNNGNGLNLLRAKLSPTGQQRLFEFLDVIDTESAARFRVWLGSASETEVSAVADLINHTSHGREFVGWWHSHDRVRAAPAVRTQPSGHSPREQAEGQAQARAAQHDMVVGGAWLAGGLLVTIGSYSLAANTPGGSHYFFAWGAILYGVIRLFRGLIR